ncbi:hypothetical protein EGH24_02235 [Halonotius terrestris]|uniref:Uncharacterized protein n=1 Tax=Halonotius terrestris TaxID=2487750 RepID=A0A8J8PDZ8_9EURY|nr:hypothetical protein [Halonotius terrestris]TQQ83631.1 hypothetical protein EGH24_02235 [Halonotius terrestris]
MPDRATELRRLADEVADHDAIDDAFVAKSFTDLLVVIDCEAGEGFPAEIETRLRDHGLDGANDVYATTEGDQSSAGAVGEATRHQFVDTETRGDHQSYVVD